MIGEPPNEPSPDQAPEPERYPFWSFADLLLVLSSWLVSMFSVGLVAHPTRTAGVLLVSVAGYAVPFLLLLAIFRLQYGRPFWRSLGWIRIPVSPASVVIAGVLTAFAVVLAGSLIRTPTTSNPMTDLLKTRSSMILVGIFGVTIGPLAEELMFRGLLQPLLVRSLGALPGILLTAIPFGLLHFPEYGNSWRHAGLIAAAGAAFGWMRHATGSTRASTLMHAAYNALFFAALLKPG